MHSKPRSIVEKVVRNRFETMFFWFERKRMFTKVQGTTSEISWTNRLSYDLFRPDNAWSMHVIAFVLSLQSLFPIAAVCRAGNEMIQTPRVWSEAHVRPRMLVRSASKHS